MTPPHSLRLTGGLIPLVAALALLAAPSTALADCAMPPPIEEAVKTADIVFVGTVTETSNRNSWATVEIEEVWRGPDRPAVVLVMGGAGGNSASSVDRSFEVGVKYLFFPYDNPDGGLRPGEPAGPAGLSDNSCTSTTQWSAELIALRPADARAPIGAVSETSGPDLGGVLAPLAVALIVAAVLLIVGLAERGRQTA